MQAIRPSTLLRRALLIDAAFSAISGLVLAAGASRLADLLGLPRALVLGAGLFCISYGAFVGYLGAREAMPRALVWLVVIGNALWAIESLALLVSGQASPTALGFGFVLAQAAAVAIIAELQAFGLKRSRATPA